MQAIFITILFSLAYFPFASLPLAYITAPHHLLGDPPTSHADEKTVLIAILARNKAHVLPQFLNCLNLLEYNKKLITLYINTNNNQDNTQAILQEWADDHKEEYKNILFEAHHVKDLDATKPHDWNAQRFKILGSIRNRSLQVAQEHACDYYFVIDCDNFIAPATLRTLLAKNKPIVAPMLKAFPERLDHYSNFFSAISPSGYYQSHPSYIPILYHQKIGTFKVPLVHCTYLIVSSVLDKLNYIDASDDYEFVVFSRSAREGSIDQFICNEMDFGYLVHFHKNVTLEEEKERLNNYFGF